MKCFSFVTVIAVFCLLKTAEPANTVGDLITTFGTVLSGSVPFFLSFADQLTMPVLNPNTDYLSQSGITNQFNQFLSTFQAFTPYITYIVQPGNAKTPAEQAFAVHVKTFANSLPQLNEFLAKMLTALQ